jgi:hypothetical protein
MTPENQRWAWLSGIAAVITALAAIITAIKTPGTMPTPPPGPAPILSTDRSVAPAPNAPGNSAPILVQAAAGLDCEKLVSQARGLSLTPKFSGIEFEVWRYAPPNPNCAMTVGKGDRAAADKAKDRWDGLEVRGYPPAKILGRNLYSERVFTSSGAD